MNRFALAWKAMTEILFPRRGATGTLRLGGTRFDYAAHAQSRTNSIVTACVNWISRTFPEAPLQVVENTKDGPTVVAGHELEKRLRRPNDAYSGMLLWMATLADWICDGNAYWLKVRSAAGRVVQLWWVPQSLIEPKWPQDGSQFISHYEYKPLGLPIRLEREDVVHFRYGVDPDNLRKGLSPLKALMREIYTDDVAANWTAAILRNLAVPGVIISPKAQDAVMSLGAKESIREQVDKRAGGDARGGTLVLDGAVEAQIISFSPRDMQLADIRDIPEERITAALGIPAAVVGLGTGLQATKVGATLREMREQAVENNIIPTQRLMAEELNTQLLPDFTDPNKFSLAFDWGQMRVFQENEDALWKRAGEAWRNGFITRNEARVAVDLDEEGPSGEVYMVPFNVVLQPAKTGGGKAGLNGGQPDWFFRLQASRRERAGRRGAPEVGGPNGA